MTQEEFLRKLSNTRSLGTWENDGHFLRLTLNDKTAHKGAKLCPVTAVEFHQRGIVKTAMDYQETICAKDELGWDLSRAIADASDRITVGTLRSQLLNAVGL